MITLKAGIYQKMILATILILGAVACFGRNTFKIDVNGNEYIVGATNINDTFELVENNEHVKLTPLIYASAYGNYKLAKFSIEKGADIEAKDNKGWTALMWASFQGHLEIVKLLVENGADVNAKEDTAGYNILLLASSEYSNSKIVDYLIEEGADIEAKDNKGWTALIWASNKGNLEMVKLLIEKGADIEAKDNDGFTALMWASFNGHLEVVKYLLENGADVNIKDNYYGITALDFARDEEIKEVLRKAGAK